MKRYLRLSAPGAAALQVWRLEASHQDLCALLGCEPSRGFPIGETRLLRLLDADGLAVFDEALVLCKEQGSFELSLHGGLGVSRAFRERLQSMGWSEGPQPDLLEQEFLHARSPLHARLAWAARDASAQPANADQVAHWSEWIELARGQSRLVIAGPTNAGKSSLMNAWLRQDRVTVSPHPGTTRDAVEASVLVGSGADAFELQLVDTAGFWAEAVGSDARAVEQSLLEIRRAWRVLWVLDASLPRHSEVEAALREAREQDFLLWSHADRAASAGNSRAELDFPGSEIGAWDLRNQAQVAARRCADAILAQLGSAPPMGLALPLSSSAGQVSDASGRARG